MCGIFGIFNVRKAAELTVLALHVEQHRARETAGIVSTDGVEFFAWRGKGVARKVFKDEAVLNLLHGTAAIGQTRYSTSGEKAVQSKLVQPMVGEYCGKPFAVVHNGNLTNKGELDRLLSGVELRTSIDTERIPRLLERFATGNLEVDLAEVLKLLRGSYALVFLFTDKMIAVQDPSSCHPLSVAKLEKGYAVASENCVFPNLGAHGSFDVSPGTMVFMEYGGLRTIRFADADEHRCAFEHTYVANPASIVFGIPVAEYRRTLGETLEFYAPAPADIVVPIPDSANFIAEGYAKSGRSGYLERAAILRNHYVGRTFLAASQARRDIEVSRKFIFAEHLIKGASIALIDDSIVRGTTLLPIVATLRECGAKEIHVRSGYSPVSHSCPYGIDTPDRSKLIAAQKSAEEIALFLGVDSVGYMPYEVLRTLYGSDQQKFCYACITGERWD